MDSKLPIDNSLELALSKLKEFLKTETVIGEPIAIGEVTLIPIITVSFGCGGGSGQGKDVKGSDGIGGGLGVGARVSPDAILVIKNGEVSILPINKKQNLEKLINMVPEVLKKIDFKKFKDNGCDDDLNEENEE